MRFYNRITSDIETGRIIAADPFDYFGSVAEAKGESKAAARRADELEKERTRIANEQLAMQRKTLEGIAGGVDQFLSPEGVGFDAETLAALNSQAIESVPAQFEDARKQLISSLTARGGAGGALPVGGDYLRNLSQLHVGREGLKANLLRENLIKNALLKLQNRFSAANVKLGVGSQFDPSTFVQGGSSALGSRVTAAQNAEQAAFAPWGALIGAAGGAAGAFLGKPPTPPACWVAAELYGGWSAPRTVEIQKWLLESENTFVRAFRWFYCLVGERWAEVIRTHAALRRMTKFIFDRLPIE